MTLKSLPRRKNCQLWVLDRSQPLPAWARLIMRAYSFRHLHLTTLLFLLLYWKYQTEENGGILTRDELVATKSCGLLRQKSTWLTAPYSLTTIGNWKNNKDKTMFSILISPCKHRNALLTLSFLQYLVSLVWLLETLGNLRIPSRWNSAILQLPWEENQRLLAISQ